MAIVTSAGPQPAVAGTLDEDRGLRIRQISIADLVECIEKGIKDFTRSSRYGMFFGAFYAVGGSFMLWLVFETGYFYLAYPMVMGFALLAPFGAAGTYEISRRLEAGEPLSWSVVFGAVWSRKGGDLAWLGLVSLFTFMIWMDIAMFVYLIFYGAGLSSVADIFTNVFTTVNGMIFLIVGNGVGALIAFCVFSFTVVSPPLIVDRNVDFVTALATSVRVVKTNPRTMLAWAVVIGMDLAVSFVTFHVALLVLFPILGHTTWHLYRKLIV
ncbi:putative membrane protein [Roseiarcus fermentans]|uniref:Putative membrane protein n=1 Tax=Roseiarcus fermentans TaxID=1473586 RepID=A0A366FQR7_9HYPH|nr:DUF2189 domain-containing protein [Roseiarcus fermentans]RBP16917.1 putative membrane protein [Roseiarcus fermentans]